MTTDPGPFAARYLDGWQDALRHLRHALSDEPCCVDCTIDRAMFAGIVAALDDHELQPRGIVAAIADGAAERLINAAMDPDPERQAAVTTMARQMVEHDPAVATEVVTLYALILSRHYATYNLGDDGTVVHVLPPGEWG